MTTTNNGHGRNIRNVPAPVRYFIFWTDLSFRHSPISNAVEGALNSMFTEAELKEQSRRTRSNNFASMKVYVTVDYDKDSGRCKITFGKAHLARARLESYPYELTDGTWAFTGSLCLKLRGALNRIADENNWDQAVFTGPQGPTMYPEFVLERMEDGTFTISAPMSGMEDTEFRRKWHIGDPRTR